MLIALYTYRAHQEVLVNRMVTEQQKKPKYTGRAECGYCQVVLSCNVILRQNRKHEYIVKGCDCGGKHRDRFRREHSNWILLPTVA